MALAMMSAVPAAAKVPASFARQSAASCRNRVHNESVVHLYHRFILSLRLCGIIELSGRVSGGRGDLSGCSCKPLATALYDVYLCHCRRKTHRCIFRCWSTHNDNLAFERFGFRPVD